MKAGSSCSLAGFRLNTKTKLDLTKLFYSQSFTTPFCSGQRYIFVIYFANKNRQMGAFYR
ncbi:MAG: hypothetical protein EGQ74_12620 [Bacteroides nordii]|nr:hypothetical protein [Bacteroides nordii]